MPGTSGKGHNKNPFAMPEPYYLPGYTGHCPKYNNIVGQTFGRATHTALNEQPFATGRLKPIPEDYPLRFDSDRLNKEDIDILEERQSTGKTVLSKDIAPGYKGHVPKASQMIGLTFNQSCVKGIAEFEKRRRALDEMLQSETQKDFIPDDSPDH